mmetsp:Transcript_62705/g.74226  ORF Transcript_62705/g.74226 Transcript_62705/m.74226 type:complete len:548 (-) Transcript_62705:143-1786(-)
MPRYSQADILLLIVNGPDKGDWAPTSGFEGWSEDKSDFVCYWEGIDCDSLTESTVEAIFIPNKNVTGFIPSELGLLKSLRKVSMPGNYFRGPIPPELASLPNLEELNLSSNRLVGPLPIFSSSKLRKLELQENQLTGTIDEKFGRRHNLIQELNLAQNYISGSLPRSIGEMKKLDSLSLSRNQMTGAIPKELEQLHNIRFIYLDKNHFVGTIPAGLADLPNLEYLWIQDNMFSGTLPAAFSDVPKLTDFYIDGNKLTGNIPEAICQKGLNQDFSGESGNTDSMDCDDLACGVGSKSDDGIGPCTLCPSGQTAPYIGWDKECIDTDEIALLDTIYKKTSEGGWTETWNLDDLHCHLPGVTCDDLGHVAEINVKGFGLIGTIPEEIGFFKYLKKLDVSDNLLSGYLPSDLRFAPLEKLDVSGNKLKGVVPLMLCMKPGINDNGVSSSGDNCHHIACPIGYYNPAGSIGDKHKCSPCLGGGGDYLGSKSCGQSFGWGVVSSGRAFGIFLGFFLLTIVVVVVVQYIAKKVKNRKKSSDTLEFERVSDAEIS